MRTGLQRTSTSQTDRSVAFHSTSAGHVQHGAPQPERATKTEPPSLQAPKGRYGDTCPSTRKHKFAKHYGAWIDNRLSNDFWL